MPRMDEENELVALRRKKLDALRAQGVEPFGVAFETDGTIAEVREKFAEGEILRAAGRITAHRDMGKSHFLDLRDATGRIQIYIHAKEVGADLIDLFLRIAHELYLKCLLVGCLNKFFEINRNFRNEGISQKHNPEFTMLEVYWAYADFEKMANLVEEFFFYLANRKSTRLNSSHSQ